MLLLPALVWAQPEQPKRPVEIFSTKAGDIKITAVRHASLLLEAGGKAIHVDPTSVGNYAGLPTADLILITDVHGDHMDLPEIAQLKKADTVIYAPEAVSKKVEQVTVLHNGDKKVWGAFEIEAVPMYNLKRGPATGKFFHDKGRGNGYVITFGGTRIYIAGDTEAIPEMKELKNIDVAFVPMNLPYTMPPEEAAEGVRAFHPKIVYPYHYKGSDLEKFKSALDGSGIEVRLRDWYY